MTTFRLDKRDAKLMGVCAGVANYTGVDLLLVRIATVLLTVCLVGGPMLLAYLVTGLVAPATR